MCEKSALWFHCGAAAFGAFVELGVPICKWFELGILAPPLAKSLLIQLEDLYRRLAIEVHKLKASLWRIGCDPAPFGEFLDALTKYECHFPVWYLDDFSSQASHLIHSLHFRWLKPAINSILKTLYEI
jgi:hypothetical protein